MCPRIEIDDDVFAHLQKHAIAFVEAPNDTLRRIFGIAASNGASERARTESRGVSRKPKASLSKMIAAGLLKNGQKLFLHDYQGRQVPNAVAFIGGDGVFDSPKKTRLCSMSDLARELLKKQGYQSDSVRGPSHWYTEEGRSVTEIWEDIRRVNDVK